MNDCAAVSDECLRAMLAEDVAFGDLTTEGLGLGSELAVMEMFARGPMRLCGSEEAARLIELAGGVAVLAAASGEALAEGALILRAHGRVDAMQRGWKTAQTLLEYLSGIASCASDILQALHEAGFELPLACTRKNFPGNRALSAKAVRAGGAIAHRLGLSETLLVFPEHRTFIDKTQIAERFAQLRRHHPEKKLVVEVADIDEAIWLARCGAEVLQLERFSPAELAACRKALSAQGLSVLLAPAGGVKRDNAVAYAQAGADFLVSSAPYFAAPRDVKVRFARQ